MKFHKDIELRNLHQDIVHSLCNLLLLIILMCVLLTSWKAVKLCSIDNNCQITFPNSCETGISSLVECTLGHSNDLNKFRILKTFSCGVQMF